VVLATTSSSIGGGQRRLALIVDRMLRRGGCKGTDGFNVRAQATTQNWGVDGWGVVLVGFCFAEKLDTVMAQHTSRRSVHDVRKENKSGELVEMTVPYLD